MGNVDEERVDGDRMSGPMLISSGTFHGDLFIRGEGIAEPLGDITGRGGDVLGIERARGLRVGSIPANRKSSFISGDDVTSIGFSPAAFHINDSL